MLDERKVKRGDTVYRVTWIDLPDGSIRPVVRAYQVTELGMHFAAVREIRQGKRSGQLGRQFKGRTSVILATHFHTPEEAVIACVKQVRRNVEEAKERVVQMQENEAKVRALSEAMEAMVSKTTGLVLRAGHCLRPDSCNPDKGPDGCICDCAACSKTREEEAQ